MTPRLLFSAAAVAAMLFTGAAASAAPSDAVLAAVADPARPAADVERDAMRKPAEMLEFAEIAPGMTVADFLPGGGYFTRIFSKAVGPDGKVFAVITPAAAANTAKPPAVLVVTADPAFANVTVVATAFADMALPAPADVIWTSQNYHDVHNASANTNITDFNRAVFAALKPGGLFVVLDHAAASDAAPDVTETLHRINPEAVRKEVEAAGFVYEGESSVLRNPDDDHTLKVFDPTLRGHTDQFVYKFRKPG